MYCPTCQVNYTASEHHCVEEKVCTACGQKKKIKEFAVHPSSFDAHRHICISCVEEQKARDKVYRAQVKQQTVQRRIEQQSQREQQNALFRAYGYKWRRGWVEKWYGDECEPEEGWVLYTPTDAQISIQDALQEISKLQEHKSGHPSALWANDLLSLSHPLVLILDTETTGFDEQAEIIDIALVDKHGQVYLNTLVQCQQESIPQEAMKVHRIHKSMLRNAPTFPQIWGDLLPLLSTHDVVIYNAEYDVRMLKQAAKRYNLELPKMRVHCLMQRYSAYVGQPSVQGDGYRRMRLAAANLHFQVEQTTAHRALVDATVSLGVLHGLAAHA